MHAMEQKKRARDERRLIGDDDGDLELPPSRNILSLGSPPLQELDRGAVVPRDELWQNLRAGPGPLGLHLTKSTLVSMIQLELDRAAREKASYTRADADHGVVDTRSITKQTIQKPSRFYASSLRIGAWEWKSRYDGDLVAKFYYANSKLAWEILNEGLKRKIEMGWQDICALKVTCPEGGPGSMEIMLSERPRFYRETNLDPRKNTMWLGSADFTNGQASMHRRHVLLCAPGILNNHIVKLLSSNRRLYSLNQENTIDQENSHFRQWHSDSEFPETSSSVQDLCGHHQFGQQKFGEPVSMSTGTNAVVKYDNISHNGMPTLIPCSVPDPSPGITGTLSGGLQLHRDMFNCDNWSFQAPRCQSQLNIANCRAMHDTMNSMIRPNKRPECYLLSSIGASSSSLMIRPEVIRKFINETRFTDQPSSSQVPPVYSDVSLNPMRREIDLSNYAFHNNTRTFKPINQRSPPSNVNGTSAAMALEKLSHDLLSDIDIEPTGVADEEMIMARVNSLNNLLNQAPTPATAQSSQVSNAAAAPPPLQAEAATQVLDMAPTGSSSASCSSNTG